VEVTFTEDPCQLSVRRGAVVVACNLDEAAATIDIGMNGCVLLGSESGITLHGDRLNLPGDSVAVVGVTERLGP
jgi:hypothetical protein